MGNFTFWAILQYGRFYILGDFGVGDSGVGDIEFFNRMGDFAVWAILEWAILELGDFATLP